MLNFDVGWKPSNETARGAASRLHGNAFLGFQIPYIIGGNDRNYFPDFVAKCKGKDDKLKNLIVEITGMSKDKAKKNGLLKTAGCLL